MLVLSEIWAGKRRCASFVTSQSAHIFFNIFFFFVNYLALENTQKYSRLSLVGSFLHEEFIEYLEKVLFLEMNV